MQGQYPNKRRRPNRAVRAAGAAFIIIILLLLVCIIELFMLASLNARVKKLGLDGDTMQGHTGALESPDTTGELPANTVHPGQKTAVLSVTEDYGQEYIDKIIFVGDSTTYGMKSRSYAVLAGGTETKQVWVPVAKGSDGTETPTLSLDIEITKKTIIYPRTGVEMTIAEAAATEKPEYMVITIGINNGVPFLTEDEFKRCYRKFLDAIIKATPDTKIILQSVYPVAKNNDKTSITNEKIDRANGWIADLALEHNLKYLNTNAYLKDTDGYLYSSYQNGDGIHLNKTGFEAVLAYIRTHGYPKND